MAAQFFGLDIGRSYIKIAQIKNLSSKKNLISLASVASPVDPVKAESADEIKKIADAVKNCAKSAKVQGNDCVVSILESQAVTRLIEMTNLTDKELTAAISWEADQYIPLPMKDVNLHYQIISRPAGQGGKMKVLLVAAPKKVISKYSDIVKHAGFTIRAMETESAALSRALSKAGEPPLLILSLGSLSTEIILAKDANVLFSRSLASGGQALTRALMTEFNLSYNQAEEYKMAYGLSQDKLSGKIANILRPVMDIIVLEILKALEFAKTPLEGYQIARIAICGGGAYLPGLSQYLVEKTSIEVSVADPWLDFAKEGLILKMPGQGSFYCAATGLASYGG